MAVETHSTFGKLSRLLRSLTTSGTQNKQEPVSAGKLKNPYTFGTPVSGKGEFFGREPELHLIFDTLENVPHGQKQDMVVLGPRRIGKSSLLRRLVNLLSEPGSNFVPVYVDLQSISPRKNHVLLLKIASEIQKRYSRRGFTLPAFATMTAETIPQDLEFLTFSEDMEQLNAAIRIGNMPRLVLMFDEAEVLVDFGGTAILEWLRSLIQALNYGVFIVAGSDRLYSLTQDYGSPFYNIFKTIELFPLERQAARKLITEPAASIGLDIRTPEVDKILDFSGGNPYFVQGIAHYLVEALNDEQRTQVNPEDVDRVIIKSVRYLSAQFGYYWNVISQVQRLILFGLAKIGRPRTAEELLEKIPTIRQILSTRREQNESLENLVQQQIIRLTNERGGYWFVVPLFAEWILSSADDQQIKELANTLQDDTGVDTSGLRRFLNLVLDDEELTRLVFDQYEAIPLDTTFAVSKAEMIASLVKTAAQQGSLPGLLAQMRERYWQQFDAFSEVISLATLELGEHEETPLPPREEYDRLRLYDLMDIHFDHEDLFKMAFMLGFDQDAVPANTKSESLREFLLLVERRGLRKKLIALLQMEYPEVEWVANR